MENKCHIVQDLLPLYIDELCSDTSKEVINEHLSICEECRTVYESMESDDAMEDESKLMERLQAKKPFQQVSRFFRAPKRMTRITFIFAGISLILGGMLLLQSIMEVNANRNELKDLSIVAEEKGIIMEEVVNVLDSTSDDSQYETQLTDIFKKFDDKLHYLAIFPADEMKEWLDESPSVKNEPTNIFPIDYQKASLVIGSDGIITNKEKINPSTYDLGNVVYANEDWVVQFEYTKSYEETIERYHQLTYYSSSTLFIFWPPILLFSIFSILFIFWWSLNKHNKRLSDVMG